jgi:NADPH2:quinone reductase
MKAIGFTTSLPTSNSNCFVETDIPMPELKEQDVLVKIKAISVNPVDYKVRQNSAKETVLPQPKIIGWDATGEVVAVGSQVTMFKVGDEVYYAGDLTRPGCYAEYQAVDERIVALKPTSLLSEEAAVLPLTSLTAWELFFDRMRIQPEKDKGKTILLIGGAGGVGSIAIQIAKKVAGLKVITTASRSESKKWCEEMGADVVVNPRNIVEEVKALGYTNIDFIADFVDVNAYWDIIVELIKPQGIVGSITGGATPIALNKLKNKSVTFCWELMYTRSMFQTDDMIQQHYILTQIAQLIDKGVLKTTVNQTLPFLTAENMTKAHIQLESGTTIGKVAVKV